MEIANSKIFNWILGLSALAVSGMAAFFSVTGIAMLFSGSFLAVALMATSLEIGKLVTASFLYRYWKTINWLQKTYMTLATVILIGITSMGIFGFLSNSYMGATVEFDTMLTKLEVYQEQLVTMEEDKVFLKEELEVSVNSLPDNYITAKRKLREEYNPLIQEKTIQIGDLKNKIGSLKIEMVDTGIDVGPLLYIADAFDTDMDTAVKWIMFILICVFDPLAVMLIISLNIVLVSGTPRRGTPVKDYKKDFEDWKKKAKQSTFLTDFDKRVMKKEKVITKPEQEHIEEKIKDTITQPDSLERWKTEMEDKIEDDNYPHTADGKGLVWEGRDKDVDIKPDDYDEKIKPEEEPLEVVSGRLRSKGIN
jgi:hypothetical protein